MNRSWWGWFTAGLALTGVVTAVWAYVAWGWPFDWWALPASSYRPSGVQLTALVAVIPLILWLAVATLKAGRSPTQPDTAGARPANGTRAMAVACAVVLGAGAVHHWLRLGTFTSGRWGAFEANVGTGLTAAVAGFLGMAIAFRPERKGITGVLGGSAAAVAMSVATLAAITTPLVHAVTAEDSVMSKKGESPAAVPTSVSRVGWRWEAPDDSLVSGVVIAGGGAVVMIFDGLVALDSVTGKERWHYRIVNNFAFNFKVSPDGSVVMLRFPGRTVLLDAYTGVVLAEHMIAWGDADDPYLHSEGIITSHPAEQNYSLTPGTLTGWHPKTSTSAWTYTPPKGCMGGYVNGNSSTPTPGALARDVYAQLIVCAPWVEKKPREKKARAFTFAVLGLDPATGAEIWRRERRVSVKPDSVRIYPSTDMGALSVIWGEDEGMVLEQASGKILAQQRITGVFGAERFLDMVSDPQKDHERTYDWNPFGAGERKRASYSLAGLVLSRAGKAETERPLTDSLVVAYPYRSRGKVTVTTFVTPWGTADTVRIPVTLPSPELPNWEWPVVAGLLPAPGAVIVSARPSSVIVGLV
ncbi:PQQ-binding-like beta-propeller repeat protein [Streptosporangium sp. NBC_01639]|uniref:hypothetical protein n=1 Tax=Streptosporangium sp. NBC_01639 TaxID=2975948 RepID=UPI00386A8D79|nr:PQQ-binding-like beta-propeller repeat protein [Streptosporangium sp. NBC_01639]